MVERKYLKIIISFVVVIFIPLSSYASSWLPNPGTYNVFITYSSIDRKSKKNRNNRSNEFVEIQKLMYKLGAKRDSIYKQAQEKNRNLLNSEIRKIESIEIILKELEEESAAMSTFSDDSSVYCDLEYGITNKQSIGLKIGYKTDIFANAGAAEESSKKLEQSTSMYYKYKFYDDGIRVATLQPRAYFSKYDKNFISKYYDLSLLLGYTKLEENYSGYLEVGITGRKYFSRYINNNIGYVINLQEGIKLSKGWTISNFTEYENIKISNMLYRSMIYDQISIAKDLNLKRNSFTLQVGYFWKSSFVNNFYTISGPIFSLWLNV